MDKDRTFRISHEAEPIFCVIATTPEGAIRRALSILGAYECDRDTTLIAGDVTRAIVEQIRRIICAADHLGFLK
jgi:hypothetical protein